jgi:hypothetical protein
MMCLSANNSTPQLRGWFPDQAVLRTSAATRFRGSLQSRKRTRIGTMNHGSGARTDFSASSLRSVCADSAVRAPEDGSGRASTILEMRIATLNRSGTHPCVPVPEARRTPEQNAAGMPRSLAGWEARLYKDGSWKCYQSRERGCVETMNLAIRRCWSSRRERSAPGPGLMARD